MWEWSLLLKLVSKCWVKLQFLETTNPSLKRRPKRYDVAHINSFFNLPIIFVYQIEIQPGHFAIIKHIHIDIICHIQLSRPGGGSSEEDSYLMRVSGVAIVRKNPKSSIAKVIEVFNVGLDSQLNILFAQTHTEIKFIPK